MSNLNIEEILNPLLNDCVKEYNKILNDMFNIAERFNISSKEVLEDILPLLNTEPNIEIDENYNSAKECLDINVNISMKFTEDDFEKECLKIINRRELEFKNFKDEIMRMAYEDFCKMKNINR